MQILENVKVNNKNIINSKKCKKALKQPKENQQNHLKELYSWFTNEEISKEIALLLKTDNLSTEFDIIFQRVEDLHQACPEHTGDWYFTGNYPTAGGNKVANKSLVYYICLLYTSPSPRD